MQLIQNGPDIPDQLMQAHEEGRVVLFCGAGVSYQKTDLAIAIFVDLESSPMTGRMNYSDLVCYPGLQNMNQIDQ